MRIAVMFLTTIAAGFVGISVFGNWLNWPDAGAVFAIATMGSFILRELRSRNQKKEGSD